MGGSKSKELSAAAVPAVKGDGTTAIERIAAIEVAGMGMLQKGGLLQRIEEAEFVILGNSRGEGGTIVSRLKKLEDSLGIVSPSPGSVPSSNTRVEQQVSNQQGDVSTKRKSGFFGNMFGGAGKAPSPAATSTQTKTPLPIPTREIASGMPVADLRQLLRDHGVVELKIKMCVEKREYVDLLMVCKGETSGDATNSGHKLSCTFAAHSGFMPTGNDVHVAEMTITKAKYWCDQHPECAGFTFHGKPLICFITIKTAY